LPAGPFDALASSSRFLTGPTVKVELTSVAVYCANAEETGKAKNAKIAMPPMVMSGVKYFFIRSNCLPERRENVKLISAIDEKILPVNRVRQAVVGLAASRGRRCYH